MFNAFFFGEGTALVSHLLSINFDKLMDPRLHTAVSSGEVFRVISVHRFEL